MAAAAAPRGAEQTPQPKKRSRVQAGLHSLQQYLFLVYGVLGLAFGLNHPYVDTFWGTVSGRVYVPSRPPVQPGLVTSAQPVPAHIPQPAWGVDAVDLAGAAAGKGDAERSSVQLLDDEGLEAMRAVGQVAAQALARAAALVAPGVSTDQLDQAVHRSLVEAGAYPSPLGFKGFPKSCCTSVNEVVVHGIPDSRPLAAGDLLNVDVTAFMDGHHADTSATFLVGGAAPSSGAEEVVAGCWRALQAALAVCGPGVPFRQLGQAVQAEAAALGLHTQPRFSGHGIGRAFHAAPSVRGAAPRGWWDLLGWLELLGHTDSWSVMQPGQAFTIEPILIERNGSRLMRKLDDGWTWVSTDRSLSAQFEVTVVVRRPEEGGGCEVLTPPLWQAARSDAATQ